MPLPVRSHAVAGDHEHGGPLDRDGVPDVDAVSVERDREVGHGGTGLAEPLGRLAHEAVDVRLRRAGPAEPLPDDPDAETPGVAGEGAGIGVRADRRRLARIEAVRTRDRLEKERAVGGRAGDGPGVVQRELDREDPGVGHEPVGGLEPHRPAIGARNPDRPALVAAERHVDLAGDHQRRAPARRASG